MKEIWIDVYEEVWNETDENTTEEQIIAETERRFKERLEAMIESRMLQQDGRIN